ncbi:SMC-Scp complex subunit ScpB [Gemmata sp.]|uniref:SMC-Scp complex subunit ScpB n=1 Tax=Gemmata sp. TaxID=1914242 RepID=UPI003F72A5A0
MSAGTHPDDPLPIPLPDLSGEWELDAEPLLEPDAEPEPEPVAPAPAPTPELAAPPAPTRGAAPPRSPKSDATPPSPEQIVEAMLFVGGHPLTADAVCAAVRGLTLEGFGAAIDALTRRYREQRRPYAVLPREGGFVLGVLPKYRGLRERLFGGPREARLSQPALDVLSVVAYRQPVGKAEVDAIRGTDSGGILRQLVRLGLIAVQHRGEATTPEVRYGTTPRFLTVFGLATLDDLPRLGDTAQV